MRCKDVYMLLKDGCKVYVVVKSEIAIFHLNSDSLIKSRTVNTFQLFSMLLNIMLKQHRYMKGFFKLCCLSRVL